jgi:hypothetical protein
MRVALGGRSETRRGGADGGGRRRRRRGAGVRAKLDVAMIRKPPLTAARPLSHCRSKKAAAHRTCRSADRICCAASHVSNEALRLQCPKATGATATRAGSTRLHEQCCRGELTLLVATSCRPRLFQRNRDATACPLKVSSRTGRPRMVDEIGHFVGRRNGGVPQLPQLAVAYRFDKVVGVALSECSETSSRALQQNRF